MIYHLQTILCSSSRLSTIKHFNIQTQYTCTSSDFRSANPISNICTRILFFIHYKHPFHEDKGLSSVPEVGTCEHLHHCLYQGQTQQAWLLSSCPQFHFQQGSLFHSAHTKINTQYIKAYKDQQLKFITKKTQHLSYLIKDSFNYYYFKIIKKNY